MRQQRNRVAVLTILVVGLGCNGTTDSKPLNPPSTIGTLVVSNITSGPSEPGPAFVYLHLDSGPQVSLPLNAAITLDSVPAGDVILGVDLLRTWCALSPNPLSVHVTGGDTTRVELDITCQEPHGAVFVSNTTTGPAIPGPSTILVTIGSRSHVPVFLGSGLTIDSLQIGPESLVVDLLRDQCSLPQNPIPITVLAADTIAVHLDITCHVTWGFINIATPTTGPNQPSLVLFDLDGVPKTGTTPGTVGLGLPYIPAGPHTFGISGVTANCALAEPNPQNIIVPLDDTVTVTFSLTCS